MLAMALVVGVTACGSSSEDSPKTAGAATSGPVTVKMLMATTQQPAMTALVKTFEAKNPNIKVQTTFVPSSNIGQLLLTQMRSGNPPDLFHLTGGGSGQNSIWPLAKAGKLLELGGEPWAANLKEEIKPALSYQDKLYAFPYGLYFFGVAYNTELFDKLGLEVPTTLADVLTMCKTITAAGKIPFSQGFSEPAIAAILPQTLMHQFVYSQQPDWSDQRTAKKVTFADTPQWKQVFDTVKQMEAAKCFGKGAAGATPAEQFQGVAKDKAVMTVIASSQAAGITAINPKIKLGFFNLPGVNAADSRAVFGTSNLGVSATTKHADAAKKFLAFLAEPANSSEFARIGGGNSYQDVANGVLPEYMQALAPLVKEGKLGLYASVFWPNPALAQYTGVATQGLLTGQSSTDSVLKTMDRLWDNPTATS
jgi:raffinose/stachyose/melibiose transport system substrate-binding protein